MRRVIELTTPHLVAHWPERVRAVLLATGEAPDPAWLRAFRKRLPGTRVKVIVQPAFGYASELALDARSISRHVIAGIMELLPQECLVPVNDADALAQRIQELLQDPNRMASLAVQSVATASRYLRSVLDIRRKEHYAILRQRTLGLASG